MTDLSGQRPSHRVSSRGPTRLRSPLFASFSPVMPKSRIGLEHAPPLPIGLTKSETPRSPRKRDEGRRGKEAHSSGQKKRGGQLRGRLGHYAVGRRGSSDPPGAGP